MNDASYYTTKEAHAVEERKKMPLRPRKCNFIASPNGAHAVSFICSDSSSLSPLYDRKVETTYMEQCFKIIGCIGEGCFGVVFKVCSLEDGRLYAVKKSRERFRNSGDRKRKLTEVERLEKLPNHPNCVQLHRAWEENGHLFLQVELCESSLAKYTMSNHAIPEEMVWNVLTDMSLALKHLHDKDIIHLDVKLDNILMANDGSFKLSDFGISLDCSQMLKDGLEGDPKYLAPELLSENFSKSADIFSLGISMLELSYDLNLPQKGELWQQLREGKIPHFRIHSVSDDLFKLVKWMMHPEPEKRPTVDMILREKNIRKILAMRNLCRVFQCLAVPGKMLLSLFAFFGQVGYDAMMASLTRLRQITQDTAMLNIQAADFKDDIRSSGISTVATSTPMAIRTAESSPNTSARVNDSWEISHCFDPSMSFDEENKKSRANQRQDKSAADCRCRNRIRVHPYNDKYYKICSICGGKKCPSVRNLLNDFSQCVKKD